METMRIEEILQKLAGQFENPPEDMAPYVRTLVNMNQDTVKQVCREYWQRGGKHFPDLAAFVARVKDLTPKPPPLINNTHACLGCRNEGWVSMYTEQGYEMMVRCTCPRGLAMVNLPTLEKAMSHGYVITRQEKRERNAKNRAR